MHLLEPAPILTAADLPCSQDRELTLLLHAIARRGDTLARAGRAVRESDRTIWMRAEFEVLEQFERARPAAFVPVG